MKEFGHPFYCHFPSLFSVVLIIENEIETRKIWNQNLFLEMPIVQLVQSSHYCKEYNLRTYVKATITINSQNNKYDS